MFIETTIVVAALLILLNLYLKLSVGRCESSKCLVGKTVLITGANSGIGYQVALILASRGCRLIIADKDNCNQTKINIIHETGNTNVVTKMFDLASLKSIRCLAKDINKTEERLDILINNAGIGGLGNSCTEDGLDIQMQVNHFGPFLLTHLLIKLMKKSKSARILFVASNFAYIANLKLKNLNPSPKGSSNLFSEVLHYSNTKLCNIITANLFAQKLKGTTITVNSVHPGVASTPITCNFRRIIGNSKLAILAYIYIFTAFTKTRIEAAEVIAHVALANELKTATGKFFIDCKPAIMPYLAQNVSWSEKVWEASESFVHLSPVEKL